MEEDQSHLSNKDASISEYSFTFSEFTNVINSDLPNKRSKALQILRPLVPKIFKPNYQCDKLIKFLRTTAISTATDSISNEAVSDDHLSSIDPENINDYLWKLFYVEHITITMLRLLSTLCAFMSPIILDALTINFDLLYKETTIHKYDNMVTRLAAWIIGTQDPRYVGLALSMLLVLNLSSILLIDSQYRWRINKLNSQVSVCMKMIIYNKILRLPMAPNKEVADPLSAIGSDIDSMNNYTLSFHQTWSSILRLLYAIFMLWNRMREASSLGLAIILSICFFNFKISKNIGWANNSMMKWRDQRVSLITNILVGIKSIKYFSWEKTFYNKVMNVRDKEFAMNKLIKYLDGACVFFWATTSVVLTVATFYVFTYMGYDIIKDNVFTTIGLFQMLILPLNDLPWTISGMLNAKASYQRVKDFLKLKEVDNLDKADDKAKGRDKKRTDSDLAIQIKCAKAIWPTQKSDTEASFSLQNIDFKIAKGLLHFIVGNVSSGKTALMQLLMDELEVPNKAAYVYTRNGSLAYASQNSWLQKGSIKDNILFGKKYDPEFYQSCLEACQLSLDIKRLTNGDNYDIGQDGVNLSGGQRQRLALARALYQNADIYLLDDIFSSVDVNVGNAMFTHAVREFLLKKNKTVVLVLSQYHYLEKIPADKKRISLVKNGCVINDEKIVMQFLNTKGPEESDRKESLEVDVVRPRKDSENIGNAENFQVQMNDESFEKGSVNFETFIAYIKAGGYIWLFLMVFGAFIMEGSRVLFDLWLKDYVEKSREGKQPLFLYQSFQVTLILMGIFVGVCTGLRAYWFAEGNLRCADNMFKKLLGVTLYSKMSFFDKKTIGSILLRFSGDTFSLDSQLAFDANIFISNVVMSIGKFIMLMIQLPLIILLIIPSLAYVSAVQGKFRTFCRDVKRIETFVGSEFITNVQETISGLKIIRAFGKQDTTFKNFQHTLEETLTTGTILQNISLWLQLRMQALSLVIALITILWINYKRFYYPDTVSALDVSLTLLYVINSLPMFEWLVLTYTATERELIGVERINEYINNDTEYFSEESSAHHEPAGNTSIEFKNVVMSYDPSKPAALRGINLKCPPGMKVAICGRTGSGKSSVLNCAIGLYQITSGEILYKGKSKTLQELRELRKHLAIIPQFGFLFEGTIQENLDPENHFTASQIAQKIKIIQEKLEKSIDSKGSNDQDKLNNELDLSKLFNLKFQITSNGANLSNGEKQVINIIRTLLRDADAVFLDEATSNMDPRTDQLIHNLLFDLCQDKTMIVITHRLEYLGHFDKIVLLHNGAIVEEGSYKELLANKSGRFSRFINQS